MKRPFSSMLGTFAVIGILLFVITNWWSFFTGNKEPDILTETMPTVSKQAAADAAKAHIAELTGYPASSTFVVYQSDKLLSGYIQKEKRVADYKSRFQERAPIDYYRVDLTDGRGAEYVVDVHMTSGAVIGWRKSSRENAPSVEVGRRIAEEVLRKDGLSLSDYSSLRPNAATPHRFVFEHRAGTIGGAKLLKVVEVRGGQATAYYNEFRIPQSHLDWVKRQDQAASAMTQWNLILSSVMGLAAIAIAIAYRKQISFVRGIGLTATFLVLYWINNINMIPAFKTLEAEGMDPFFSTEAAVVTMILMTVVVTIMAIICYFSFAAGDPLWREQGRRLWPRWREPGFGAHTLSSMKRGYLLAFGLLGVQSLLFFTAEHRFDMWAVNDPSGSPLNMLLPGIFPLMAWTAAISEEAIYRFFGIALFKKLLRNTFLAVVIPSVIWAFSHTQYPIYPVYTRFVEVTILGILFGYAFLKYGFATALFAHAIVDSILMSFSLMGMGGAGYVGLGAFYIALPALVAIVIKWLHGKTAARRPGPGAGDPPPDSGDGFRPSKPDPV
ncbi:CPBP family intramembrane glutamic endopeptidase [Paenibacillus sp. GCM10012303]|uniref:CPBP family intramembrane glutamic endopeptidase n=1 Tax=Paenibacillus sp. GCM10012303 TaxID=3317340 RepID=UPI00360ACF44